MTDTLFDVPAVHSRQLPQRMGHMLLVYGCGPEGERCGTCAQFRTVHRYKGRWHKCGLNRDTGAGGATGAQAGPRAASGRGRANDLERT